MWFENLVIFVSRLRLYKGTRKIFQIRNFERVAIAILRGIPKMLCKLVNLSCWYLIRNQSSVHGNYFENKVSSSYIGNRNCISLYIWVILKKSPKLTVLKYTEIKSYFYWNILLAIINARVLNIIFSLWHRSFSLGEEVKCF